MLAAIRAIDPSNSERASILLCCGGRARIFIAVSPRVQPVPDPIRFRLLRQRACCRLLPLRAAACPTCGLFPAVPEWPFGSVRSPDPLRAVQPRAAPDGLADARLRCAAGV